MLKSVHFTHNDGDAVGCEIVYRLMALKHFHIKDEDALTFFCSNGDIDDIFKDYFDEAFRNNEIPDVVIISDNSISKETYDWFNEAAGNKRNEISVYGYDHHGTNPLIEEPFWMVKEGSKSAAYIMYDFYKEILHIDQNVSHIIEKPLWKDDILMGSFYADRIEEIINAISRYDTWEWKKHPVKNPIVREDMVAVITNMIGVDKTARLLVDYYKDSENTKYYPEYFNIFYDGYKEKEKKNVEASQYSAKIIDFFNYHTACILGSQYANAIAENLYKDNKKIDIVMILYPNIHNISFRSSDDGPDVSIIAKILSEKLKTQGGGHPHASGVNIPEKEFNNLIMNYFNPKYSTSYQDYMNDPSLFDELKTTKL